MGGEGQLGNERVTYLLTVLGERPAGVDVLLITGCGDVCDMDEDEQGDGDETDDADE